MIRRVVLLIFGVLITCLGMVLNTRTGLGVAALVSLPFAISQMTALSLGTATAFIYIIYVVCQILILRKIQIKTLLQIPFSYVFGAVLDLYQRVFYFEADSLFKSILFLALAILLTALGAYFIVTADLIMNPADGLIKETSVIAGKGFGKTKLVFDCAIVGLTAIISFAATGSVIGIGIGTVVSAATIGNVISIYAKHLNPWFQAGQEV